MLQNLLSLRITGAQIKDSTKTEPNYYLTVDDLIRVDIAKCENCKYLCGNLARTRHLHVILTVILHDSYIRQDIN